MKIARIMSDMSIVKNKFWSKKIKEYEKRFVLQDNASPGNTDQNIKWICAELKRKYGEKNIYCARKILPEKRPPKIEWDVILQIQKSGYEKINVRLSNYSISSWYEASFIIQVEQGEGVLCHSNRREEIVKLFAALYDDYEKNMEKLSTFIVKEQRSEKLRKIGAAGARILIPKEMAKTNYEWNLVEEKTRSVLHIKTKRGKMIEISLGHKTFLKLLPDMIKVIEQTERYLDSVPYPVNIKNCSKSAKWRKGGGE